MIRFIYTPRIEAWLNAVPGRSERLQDARLRARGRCMLQSMGMTEADIAGRHRLEVPGMVHRPDEWSPCSRIETLDTGRRLARKYGW